MEVTLSTLVDQFLESCTITNAARTVDNYRRYLTSFEKAVNGKPLDELRSLDLLKWGKTWHQIQAVQRLFNWACLDAQVITKNPFRKVRKPPAGQRKRTLTRRGFFQLCRASSRCFRDVLITMRETIARPQEVRGLCWELLQAENPLDDVIESLRRGHACFVLDTWKSRDRMGDPSKPRLILVSKRLGRLLCRLAARRGEHSGPIFLNSQGRAWTANAVRLRMRALRRRLHLGKDHRGESIVAYTIRHTGGTNATARGMRDRLLADIMGHTSTRTTARYQHLDVGHLRDAFDRLAQR